jgi:response regulator RpfG family c-di-GMP phosphodiesterase
MITDTIKANSLVDLKQTLVSASHPNTLLFGFASSDIDHCDLYKILTDKGYITVTSSSGGQFIGGELLYSGIICMILVLPENSFKIKRCDEEDYFFDTGLELGKFAQNAFAHADALIFANSYPSIDHEAILDGFDQGANNKVSIFGGLASNSQFTSDNYIGIDGVVSKKSAGVVVFDRTKIALQGVVTGGWQPIGTYKTVTKSVGKKVYEFDHKPVKDVYHDYFNDTQDSLASRYLEFPIQVTRQNGGKFLRSISEIEPDGFCYSGHIPEGTKVYFCSPSITETISTSVNEINDFQLKNKLMDSSAVLVFSCSARLQSFGFYIQNELRSFNEMWGLKHIGLFSHGEIGRYNDEISKKESSVLHNNCISVVFFKDLTGTELTSKKSKNIHYHEEKVEVTDILDKNAMVVKLQEQKLALSSLLQRTSLDLNNALNELDEYKKGLEDKVNEQLKDITELNKEIIDTQKEVIFTMGAIAETRSKETGNHVIRVAEYSKLFSLFLGLSEQESELIKQASPMHDIGKVGIPDAILNKPGRLTPEEFVIIKTHAELGYSMLRHSKRPILMLAATIAHEHHEKWDGSGYPCGLSGKEISIYGRITAIADVFDALGTERCYKKAWKDDDIWAFFKRERGKHFDPKLVDIFFKHFKEFIEIRQQYLDI